MLGNGAEAENFVKEAACCRYRIAVMCARADACPSLWIREWERHDVMRSHGLGELK
jgi:hypothetical protein